MFYQTTEEFLEDAIPALEIQLRKDIVERLSQDRDDIEDFSTKRLLQSYIDKYAVKYKVCKNCFSWLTPVVSKDFHDELDENSYRLIVDGYECEKCGNKYNL